MTTPIIIRASGGLGIGLGHLQRCIALARELPCDWRFSSDATPETLRDLGIDTARIIANSDWPNNLPSNAVVVMDTLHHNNAQTTAAEVTILRRTGHRVAIIDSMPPDHYMATGAEDVPDLLVTPYHAADALRPRIDGANWLAGSRYAILPAAYRDARDTALNTAAENILIACGGADPSGLSLRAAKACISGPSRIDIVVGPQFSPAVVADLQTLAAKHTNITLHQHLTSLIPLYLTARLVIGRPGLIRYEAACLGRKGLYLWERSEYRAYFESFRDSGLAEVYFSLDTGGEDAFFARIAALTRVNAQDDIIDQNAMSEVDGLGVTRVAEAVMKLIGEQAK